MYIIQFWDDILRFIATIRLKETTASDIFRRLNSYSKQHGLYHALKAFGQILKSIFILRVIDEPVLRMSIEKVLSGIEHVHAFTRAVSVGNPREFLQAEKEDQEMAEAMRDGLIMQLADPLTLYRKPENLFVAGFIGGPPMNLLKGKVQRRDGGLFFAEAAEKNALTFPLKGRLEPLASRYVDKDIVFGIRPEHITNEPKEGSSLPVTLTVDIAEPMGSESLVYLKAGTGNLIARIHGEHLFHLGEQVTVQLDLEKVSLFDVETEKVIR